MKKLKLTDIAPYSGKRVQPFDGVKRYMSTGDLKGDNLSFEDVTYESKPSRADIIVSEGDILFAKMTNTNKAFQIDKEHDGIIVSTGFSVHRPLENKMLGEYFLHFLKHNSFQRQKNKLCTGAIQSAISNRGIEKILVPVPDFNDQLHIANLLSKAENLISQRKESIRMLDEFLKSTFLEMFGDPIANKKKWKSLQVSEYGESRLGKMLDGKKIIGNNLKPYLRNSNVLWFGFKLDDLLEMDFDEKDRVEFNLRNGDILMCEGGEIGRCAIWRDELEECYFQKAIHRIRLNKDIALPEYFVYMFWLYTLNGGLNKYMGAATISHLTGEKLKKMKLPIPPIELQTQFAQIVEETEAIKTQYQQSLQELENLYGSLSQKAFKGELVSKKREAKVVTLTPETKLVQPELNKQQAFLRKLMLASHIIYELCDEPTFGHTKLMKLLYLTEQAGGMALQTSYKKFAAGPFDGKTLTLIDKEFAKNKWFTIEKKSFTIGGQKREATVYKKTEKSLLYKKHFDNYFESESETINRIIALLRKEKTQTAEIVATLYFAWKELITANTMLSEDSLVKGFYQFHKEKRKFTEEQILLGYEYMQTNELYPQSV
jgi:restriction endonuclease S subunit